jgi:hypothetical protein
MNNLIDDESWAPGREAIEREKDAARIWLTRRDWKTLGSGRENRRNSRWPFKTARWAAALAGAAILLSAVLLLRPVFRSRVSFASGFADSLAMVFERVRTEGQPLSSRPGRLNDVSASEAAWSIQRVFCVVSLEDAFEDGLPQLIEKALGIWRRDGEAGTEKTARKDLRRSDMSEIFMRFYKSIKEG